MATSAQQQAAVSVLRLSDGLIVRLSGDVTAADLPQLRRALLMPLPRSCRDVIIDAGDVSTIDDAALAAIVAARDWIRAGGGRLIASRISHHLTELLDEVNLGNLLPILGPPQRPATALLPRQRGPQNDRRVS